MVTAGRKVYLGGLMSRSQVPSLFPTQLDALSMSLLASLVCLM